VTMETVRISPVWIGLLGASILCDVVATAYLKWAGDRFAANFLLANVLSIALFAPAIVTFGYALREGPSYLVTTLVWVPRCWRWCCSPPDAHAVVFTRASRVVARRERARLKRDTS
jgi:hypothetical protein